MTISRITIEDAASYLRLGNGEYVADDLRAMMAAAKSYISKYTGLPVSSTTEGAETIDSHEDLYIAYMVLVQDMHDNRTLYVDKTNVNRVVESILGMYSHNLV